MSDSVAPLVKITSPGSRAFIYLAIKARPSSTACCASCPYPWSTLAALPNISLLEDSIIVLDNLNGNSDGFINPGETVEINFIIENLSDEMLSDCYVEVSSNYNNIQMLNNMYEFDFLEANGSISVNNISKYIDNVLSENDNSFSLVVSMDCSGINWSLFVPISINYGSAEVSLELVSDQNNNMILDPGETAQFKVIANNNGYIPT